MKAWLLDGLGYKLGEVECPCPAPLVCVWGDHVFMRRPERDDPAKPHVKMYVEVTFFVCHETSGEFRLP